MKDLAKNLRNDFLDKEYAQVYLEEFLNISIATQIKVLREQRNLTQKKLAELADMEQSRISLLENVNYDKWTVSSLKKLADAFDVGLKISFENYSKIINDIQDFDRKSLEKKSRLEDLSNDITFVDNELASISDAKVDPDHISRSRNDKIEAMQNDYAKISKASYDDDDLQKAA